jgi:hypothetical protein
MGSTPLSYDAPTDRLPHPATPPALGPAGSVVTDPVYGTKILRVTDVNSVAGTNLSYRVANEFWGNDWNTDATLFYFQASSGAFLPYKLDPKAFAATRATDAAGQPLKMPLAPGGFSRVHPTIFFGIRSFTIAQYDFGTGMTTDVVPLTTIAPGATGYALTVEEGMNGLFATSFGGPQQDKMPYVATYDPTTGTPHLIDVTQSTLDGHPIGATIGGGVHSIHMDQSGRYVSFSVNGGAHSDWVWDTMTASVTAAASAGTIGSGDWIHHQGNDAYQWAMNSYAAPSVSNLLITPVLTPADTHASASLSWSNAIPGAAVPVIVETMRQPMDTGPLRAWDGEIIAVRTDGTLVQGETEVWRFAHNFNTYSGTIYSDNFYYLFIPRVSQNGWFVLFDSNWNQTLGTDSSGNPRTDVFIAALSNSCGP